MGLIKWHFGVTVGKRKSYKIGPLTRLVFGKTWHFGRRRRRRSRRY